MALTKMSKSSSRDVAAEDSIGEAADEDVEGAARVSSRPEAGGRCCEVGEMASELLED